MVLLIYFNSPTGDSNGQVWLGITDAMGEAHWKELEFSSNCKGNRFGG